MAATRKKPSLRAVRGVLTKSDWRLLACVAIFAASVGLKYADGDAARALRTQAASLLHGGTSTGEVLEVMGKTVDESGVLSAFGDEQTLRAVFGAAPESAPESAPETIPATAPQTVPAAAPAEKSAAADAGVGAPTYAEGGYSEDLEDRAETLFPREADETAYVMAFAHVQPVAATLSSTFGARTHPISGKSSYHFGLDLAAPKGTPILSLADGTVRSVGDGSYGKHLIVDHADGFSTLYAHCDKLLAKQGDIVRAGQEIAQVGATGNATGNHLHFELWRGGKALNPLHYVQY